MLEDNIIQKLVTHEMQTIYVLTDLFEWTDATHQSKLSLLSPFDNSIIHRERVKTCFDFDFRLECYTPQHKENTATFVCLFYLAMYLLVELIAKRIVKVVNLN
jgi:uncharacterized protein YcaQ